MLSASLDTAICPASAWCILEVPGSPHLPGSTLYLDQWALIHKCTTFLGFVGTSLRHVLHCIPEVPSKTEPKLFTRVICTTGYFPSPISLRISLLVPWEHLQNKRHALKCFPTIHNQVPPCQKTLGDSAEHPSELSHLRPRRLMYLPTDILLVIGKGCFQGINFLVFPVYPA